MIMMTTMDTPLAIITQTTNNYLIVKLRAKI